MRAMEFEMIKLIWRRTNQLKYETFDDFLKKFYLKEVEKKVEKLIKNVYEQVCCMFFFKITLVNLKFETTTNSIEIVGNMISNQYGSDITFIIGDQIIPAHKVILARCDYFKAMFSFEESNNQKEIIIEEDERPFLAIIDYIYTGNLNPKYSDQCLIVLELAEKYSLENRIKHLCAFYIYENLLDFNNFNDVYKLAKDKEDRNLIYACELFIARKFEIFKNQGFFNGKKTEYIHNFRETTSKQILYSKYLFKQLDFTSGFQTRTCLVLGDQQCGKSNLILKFTNTNDTMCKYTFQDPNSNKFELTISEISREQDNYFTLLKGVDSYVVCYSVTEEKSFEAAREIIKEIYDSGDSPYNIILAALKMDLTFLRSVSYEKGIKLADEFDIPYFEVSSQYMSNLLEIWNEIAQTAYNGRGK